MDVKGGAGPGCVRSGLADHVILVVAPQNKPVISLPAAFGKFPALCRLWTAINYIAGDDDDIGLPGINVFANSLICGPIRMDV